MNWFLNKIARRLEKILTVISWSATLFITFITMTDVVLRFFFDNPLPATWEISQIFMPYVVFFAFAETLYRDAHVRVSILTDRFSLINRRRFSVVTGFLTFLFCALITYTSAIRFWKSFITDEEILAAIYVPWWIGKFAMPVGMGSLALRYFLRFCSDSTEVRRLRSTATP